jgi:DNA-binding response OmpR family regulator
MHDQMTQSPHIIIVDDEAPAREMVGEYLKMHGFTVTLCDGGKSLRGAIESNVPDLVVLDLNMPEEDGLSIIRDLKSRTNVPVIMLTATASPIDRVVGLELGADDYLPKPFEPRELLARLKAILRRAGNAPSQTLRFGRLEIDLGARKIMLAGEERTLTSHQFALLAILAQHAGRVLSRDAIMDLLKNERLEAFDRSIDVHISRIRAAIEDDPKKPQRVITVRGAGYVFAKAQN